MPKGKEKEGYKPAAERRVHPYTVRYNDEENALIEAAAAHKALEAGSWIRMVSVEAAREQAKKTGGGR
jgi:hypothetical protein